jgi:hypothetical protein
MLTLRQINLVSELLSSEDISLSDLFCAYISGTLGSFELTGNSFNLRKELCTSSMLNNIIATLLNAPDTSNIITCIARNVTTHCYIREIGALLTPAAGFQFNASHAASSQFESFSSIKMAKTFEELCPTLWKLFGVLLNGAAVQHASATADKQGDYWTEITYRHKEDMPSLATKEPKSSNAPEQTVAECLDDMPDEDWGGQSDEDDSSDEDEDHNQPGEPEVGSVPSMSNEWSVRLRIRKKKHAGEVLERQLKRTLVVRVNIFAVSLSRCLNCTLSAVSLSSAYAWSIAICDAMRCKLLLACSLTQQTHLQRLSNCWRMQA